MKNEKRIEIPLSKTKIMLILVCTIVFLIIGLCFIIWPENFLSHFGRPCTIEGIRVWGIFGSLFFGLGTLYALWKLFDQKPGLIIDREGLLDNSSGIAAGRIPWADVTGVSEWEYHGPKMVVLLLKDPQRYISPQSKALKRKAMLENLDRCGSPVVISAVGLKISYKELYALLREQYAAYAAKA